MTVANEKIKLWEIQTRLYVFKSFSHFWIGPLLEYVTITIGYTCE